MSFYNSRKQIAVQLIKRCEWERNTTQFISDLMDIEDDYLGTVVELEDSYYTTSEHARSKNLFRCSGGMYRFVKEVCFETLEITKTDQGYCIKGIRPIDELEKAGIEEQVSRMRSNQHRNLQFDVLI